MSFLLALEKKPFVAQEQYRFRFKNYIRLHNACDSKRFHLDRTINPAYHR